jgi:aldose 1-epimerase
MTRYEARTAEREGETIYELRDGRTGAFAHVWPAFGNNCIAARLPSPGGGLVEALLAPETLAQVREQPSWWGVPLLFPWPGRVPEGRYRVGGEEYRLPELNQAGAAIHGFVKTRAWRVEMFEAWESAGFFRASFSSDEHPETLEGFPFPYYLAVTYRLDNDGLHIVVEVANRGKGPLPFGFGAHPYFRLPLGDGGDPQQCTIRVPAAQCWTLSRLGSLGGREQVTRDDVTEPVPAELDLREGQALAGRHFDHVYTDLDVGAGRVEFAVADSASGLESVLQASPHFPTLVVYTPPGRPGVCFEPWTCPPNGFNVLAAGVVGSGVTVLEPGQRWEGSLRLFVRSTRRAG